MAAISVACTAPEREATDARPSIGRPDRHEPLAGAPPEGAWRSASRDRSTAGASPCPRASFAEQDLIHGAIPIGSSGSISASVCRGTPGLFRFRAPVPEGGLFTVSVESQLRELSAIVTSSTNGVELSSPSPFENETQPIGVVSDGGDYTVRVAAPLDPATAMDSARDASARAASARDASDRAASDPAGPALAATFTLRIQPLAPATNDCCSAGTSPGCADPAVLACLCQQDNACCATAYDDLCVTEAMGECGASCAGAATQSDGCSPSPAPGASSPSVESCVCAIDPYCCVGGFDQNCVHLAQGRCALPCDGALSGAP